MNSLDQKLDELDHPCKHTCSGWKQGFEKGAESKSIITVNSDEIGNPSPLIHAFILVNLFFEKNDDKTLAWFTTKNPNLGNVEPLELFKRGRGHKVLAFIDGSTRENLETIEEHWQDKAIRIATEESIKEREREVDNLRKDKARIDWLTENKASITRKSSTGWWVNNNHLAYSTPREAIDAAMKESGKV